MTTLIWLYVILDRGGSDQQWRTPHPTYASCFAALRELRMSNNGRTDEVVVAWCGGDIDRHYGSTWWRDNAKASK
jgi:hypothetical protein